MSIRDTAADIDAERHRTHAAQGQAADPRLSVWVSANAGAGKTHVLTMRVLRLLLTGTAPERLLCLTYTKAAAAEMSQRVFEELARWVTASTADLDAALARTLGRPPDTIERSLARTLFTRAIETPGGLKVQTIHAFCERLLKRFPLEAGVPPAFSILDEETATALLREAIDATLRAATRDPGSALGRSLTAMIAYAAEDGFDEILGEALGERGWIEALARRPDHGENDDAPSDPMAWIDEHYRALLGVRPAITPAEIEAQLCDVLPAAQLRRLQAVLGGGGKTDVKHAEILGAAIKLPAGSERAKALGDYLLTGKGEPRTSLMSKALKDEHPDLDEIAQRAQTRFLELTGERLALKAIGATVALLQVAQDVLQRYHDGKMRRAALDFDDLIVKTARLLDERQSAEWVLYKLDGGLDHILVDESQDTSPQQWAIVAALAREFFAGAGTSEIVRTLFAVGDEKQSIYSFQGAAPEQFSKMGQAFATMAAAAGRGFVRVPLTLSFRTVEPVLGAVDAVFADARRTPGLVMSPTAETAVRHIANRAGHGGVVEVWPTEAAEKPQDADAWSPLDDAVPPAPAVRVAHRIADTIQGWLERGETLVSEGRKVRAGDILILVRKRRPFAEPMVAALKARGIAVAGADRIELTQQLVVQDILALGDFLVLPEDDLALACVLKSPLIGLDDDDLLAIAPGRKGTLWAALLAAAKETPRLAEAAETLRQWRAKADFSPPYEFFATLLERSDFRARILARLGPEAADPLDELLNLALTYDDGAPPSLQGFLCWLREGTRQIKRDMEHGRDEVRILTVHGAKGLEAPIVFLPDTCSSESGRRSSGLVRLAGVPMPSRLDEPLLWPVKGTGGIAAVKAAKAHVAQKETEERNRLLYVAMTRARDRLYVTGFEGTRGRSKTCWYDLICDGLAGQAERFETADGRTALRLAMEQRVACVAGREKIAGPLGAAQLPAWASAPVVHEPQLTVPLSPSKLAPYDVDAAGEPTERAPQPSGAVAAPPATPSPAALAEDGRFLRGTLTHALLEHLPGIERSRWSKAAKDFLAVRGAGLTGRARASIVKEVLAILDSEDLAALFGPDSRAEVPIAAEIKRPKGKGPALKILGQIDRLAVVGDEVLILDYKTNRMPPARAEEVADAYLYQLAAYRLAVGHIFAGKTARAAIIWTDGPVTMPIPSELLDRYASQLWTLDPARLDA